jgi:hypothetical protein
MTKVDMIKKAAGRFCRRKGPRNRISSREE